MFLLSWPELASQAGCPTVSPLSICGPHHIGEKRFYDFNVRTERKRIEKLRCIHRNPVERGLVESPELWPWSSFRAYAFGEVGPVKVNEWQGLKMKVRPPAARNQSPLLCRLSGGPGLEKRET